MKKLVVSLLVLLNVVGCSPNENQTVDIVVSSYALYFLVDEIVPDSVIVELDSEDSHSVATGAKLVLYVDESYDNKLSSVTNSIEILPMLYTKRDNPNFWVSPKQMIIASEVVYSLVLNTFPEHKDELLDNYSQLLNSLNDLDNQYANAYNKSSDKTIYAYDNTFEYFEDYGFEYISIQDSNATEILSYLDKKIVCSTISCISGENEYFRDVNVVTINDLRIQPENGNYLSGQFKNILLLESLG